jgi:hypothetical protein
MGGARFFFNFSPFRRHVLLLLYGQENPSLYWAEREKILNFSPFRRQVLLLLMGKKTPVCIGQSASKFWMLAPLEAMFCPYSWARRTPVCPLRSPRNFWMLAPFEAMIRCYSYGRSRIFFNFSPFRRHVLLLLWEIRTLCCLGWRMEPPKISFVHMGTEKLAIKKIALLTYWPRKF